MPSAITGLGECSNNSQWWFVCEIMLSKWVNRKIGHFFTTFVWRIEQDGIFTLQTCVILCQQHNKGQTWPNILSTLSPYYMVFVSFFLWETGAGHDQTQVSTPWKMCVHVHVQAVNMQHKCLSSCFETRDVCMYGISICNWWWKI